MIVSMQVMTDKQARLVGLSFMLVCLQTRQTLMGIGKSTMVPLHQDMLRVATTCIVRD